MGFDDYVSEYFASPLDIRAANVIVDMVLEDVTEL